MRALVIRSAVLVASALVLVTVAQSRTQAADMKLEAHLVWGTDDPSPPPGKDYKPANAEIRKILTEGPLKWKNWFEVNKKGFSVPPSGTVTVPVSEKCEVIVKNLGGDNFEFVLMGKGKEAGRRKQPLPKSNLLMLSGPAPNATAWVVVIKRIE